MWNKKRQHRELPRGPMVVRIQHCHCCGLGSTPGPDFLVLQAWAKKRKRKRKEKKMNHLTTSRLFSYKKEFPSAQYFFSWLTWTHLQVWSYHNIPLSHNFPLFFFWLPHGTWRSWARDQNLSGISNTGSLTHCARLGIEPASQCSRDTTNPTVPQQELLHYLIINKNMQSWLS